MQKSTHKKNKKLYQEAHLKKKKSFPCLTQRIRGKVSLLITLWDERLESWRKNRSKINEGWAFLKGVTTIRLD